LFVQVTGSSLFPGWFSNWILLYAVKVGAIIVSPNYRLLPEVSGRDILDDMGAFWTWFHADGPQKHLVLVGREDIKLQTENEKHLLIGESAGTHPPIYTLSIHGSQAGRHRLTCAVLDNLGGYLAIQSLLSEYTRPRALITMYPMLDLKSEYYTRAFEKPIVGVPDIPNEVIDQSLSRSASLSSNEGSAVITEADPPDRLALALAMVQNGRVLEFLGVGNKDDDDHRLFPLERLAQKGSGSITPPLFPPTLILHGSEDTAVPVSGTRKFVETLRNVDPSCDLRVIIRPGDHGFDAGATLETPWLADALEFVSRAWLGLEEGVGGVVASSL
jgi:acetyl esterase/lipase